MYEIGEQVLVKWYLEDDLTNFKGGDILYVTGNVDYDYGYVGVSKDKEDGRTFLVPLEYLEPLSKFDVVD